MKDQNNFKPYIPAEKVTPEITVTSIIMGVLLAVIFGAANAYLGLRVGMTVSASIPAAVIAMGVIRVIMRKNSILESNIVQTTGSAGESLAAGAIFTLPALFLLNPSLLYPALLYPSLLYPALLQFPQTRLPPKLPPHGQWLQPLLRPTKLHRHGHPLHP